MSKFNMVPNEDFEQEWDNQKNLLNDLEAFQAEVEGQDDDDDQDDFEDEF